MSATVYVHSARSLDLSEVRTLSSESGPFLTRTLTVRDASGADLLTVTVIASHGTDLRLPLERTTDALVVDAGV